MLPYLRVSAIVLPAVILVRDTLADKTMTNLVDNKTISSSSNSEKVPTTSVVSHIFCSSCLDANIKAARSSHAEVGA